MLAVCVFADQAWDPLDANQHCSNHCLVSHGPLECKITIAFIHPADAH